jgi:hypothetical protein
MNEDSFVATVLGNAVNRAILDCMPALGLADAWLVSGSLFQTVWNALAGHPSDFGIKDYDIFYFDPDTSFETEDEVIRRVAAGWSDLHVRIEPRNQARVHLWYPHKFGVPYAPLQRSTDGIDRFLVRAAQLGIRPAGRGYEIYAPHGFDDLVSMTVRPNYSPNFRAGLYEQKAARWKALWPALTVLPALPDAGRLAGGQIAPAAKQA